MRPPEVLSPAGHWPELHAAIDAGADVVMGTGPHFPLPVEIYKGRPIFYGLGNFTFSTGHLGRKHAGWVGLLVEMTHAGGAVAECSFRLVRSNADNESFLPGLAEEAETLESLTAQSAKRGTTLKVDGDRVRVLS